MIGWKRTSRTSKTEKRKYKGKSMWDGNKSNARTWTTFEYALAFPLAR